MRTRRLRQLLTDQLYAHAYPWASLTHVVAHDGGTIATGGRRRDGSRYLVLVADECQSPCLATRAWQVIHGDDAPTQFQVRQVRGLHVVLADDCEVA